MRFGRRRWRRRQPARRFGARAAPPPFSRSLPRYCYFIVLSHSLALSPSPCRGLTVSFSLSFAFVNGAHRLPLCGPLLRLSLIPTSCFPVALLCSRYPSALSLSHVPVHARCFFVILPAIGGTRSFVHDDEPRHARHAPFVVQSPPPFSDTHAEM